MNSGLSHVPYSFGQPVVMANWTLTGTLPPFPRQGIFLPKLIYSTTGRRLLPFRDLLAPVWRDRSYRIKTLEDHGARLVENTAEEIDEIVHEMLDRLQGRHKPSAKETHLQEKFAALLPDESPRGISKIGTGFLKRHASLL